jgi:hypothetical protein
MLEIPNEQIAWTYYKSVEDDFIDYLDCVPWTNAHKKVWSPKLANLLLNICSIIDSIFKYCLKGPAMNSAKHIKEIRTKDKPSINDFQKVYNDVYSLSDRVVYLLSTEEKLIPWSNWQNQKSSPAWWTAYNHIKHNRFKNKTEATLENTLYALSGLFLVCVLLKEFRQNLVDMEIIKGGSFDKDHLKSVLREDEPIDEVEPIIAKSKLFKYTFLISGVHFRGGNRKNME